jgi:enoyl-CoA hydratase/carnithine racemase
VQIGLVSWVVRQDQLLGAAHELAQHLAANPPLAVQAAKHALRLARAGRGEELRSFLGTQGRALLATEDHEETVAAFLEQRDPTFNGR